MKLIHWQIYAAAATVGAVGALVLLVQSYGDQSELQRQLERARKQGNSARPAAVVRPAATPRPSADETLLRTRVNQLERQLAQLRAERDRLRQENATLKQSVAAATAAAERTVARTTAGGPRPAAVTNPLATTGAGAAGAITPRPGGPAQPVPVPEPSGEPWGASTEGELDRLATALRLDQPQREEVKRIIIDAQKEFEKRLIQASQSGERDITIIDRIGQEISRRTEQRIRQILRPEQQPRLDRYLAEQEQN